MFSIVFIRTINWNDHFNLWLNQKLVHKGWEVEIEESSGSFVGTTYLKNVMISHTSGSLIEIEKLTFNLGLLSSIIQNPVIVFDLIIIEGFNANYNVSNLGSNQNEGYKNLTKIPYQINTFFIDGMVASNLNGNDVVFNILMGGELNTKEYSTINFDLFKISFEQDPQLSLHFDQLVMGDEGGNYYLKDINGFFLNLPIKGDVYFEKVLKKLKGTVNLMNFSIPAEMFTKLPLKTKFSNFNGEFNFVADFNSFIGEIILDNKLGLDMKGEFSLRKDIDIWLLENLTLFGEQSKLQMNGSWVNGQNFNCFMNLENLDLSRWIKNQKPTKMSGLFIMDATLDKGLVLDQINMNLEMVEEKLFDQGDISVHGLFTYKDSTISTISPVIFLVGDSYLTINGEGDFKQNSIDIFLDLEKADIELVNNFLPGDFISGIATGKLKIYGDFDKPSVLADLSCENIIISEFYLESLKLNSQMFMQDSILNGFIDIKSGKGEWRERSFDSGTVYGIFDNQSIVIENFHFQSDKDFLQLSGIFDGIYDYKIDRIQLAYKDNYLVNAKPISFKLKDSNLTVKPFEFHINDGLMEGVIIKDENLEGRFKMSNFDAEVLTQFIDDNRLKMSGLVFGEILIENHNDDFDIDVDLSFKKGVYMEESFDEMVISGLYKNGVLHLDDISMTKENLMGLHIDGIIPLKEKNNIAIAMESSFSNLSLEFLHRFIPKFFNIGGKATGSISLNGTNEETYFIYDINIDKPKFDLVKMDNLVSKGRYNGKKLFVEMARASNEEGLIHTSGFVPFDLNIGSNNFGKYFENDSIKLKTEADLSNLPFLSPYIIDLDSVDGKYKINLFIDGTVNNINRNGNIFIQNGVLYTQLLNDPIRFIYGEAQLINNRLNFNKFTANLHYENGKNILSKTSNTYINGEIDLTKFFEPYYNLKVNAKKASFRLLSLDIYGQTTLDIAISGRDTVSITGKIEPQEVNVFYEFATEDIGSAIAKEQGIIMSYNLNIPLRNKAFFQNSQIDAEINGELNLSQIGYQEIDFGGQIIVENGSAFTHKDNFENLNGIVTFDNKGFNPLINLSAYTMIDNERIELRMVGGIDDPEIILESASGFSESDILELLTWGKRFEDQEGTSTGFGNQTVSFLGALLETQLEKNIKESNISMINYFDDINISGAAGFLQGSSEDFKLAAKKQIGDKTFLNLSYKRSFSLNDQSQLGVEYKLNRHFSVVANVGKDGNYNVKYRYKYAY